MFGWIEAISYLRLRRGFSVRYLDLIDLENKLILPGLQECHFFYEGRPYVVCIIPLDWNRVN